MMSDEVSVKWLDCSQNTVIPLTVVPAYVTHPATVHTISPLFVSAEPLCTPINILVVPEVSRTATDYTYSGTEAYVSSFSDSSTAISFPPLTASAAVFNFRIEAQWIGSVQVFSDPISVLVISCSHLVPNVPTLSGTAIT